MVNEVLFEHVRPSLDNVEQTLLEWPRVNSEPQIEHGGALHTIYHMYSNL